MNSQNSRVVIGVVDRSSFGRQWLEKARKLHSDGDVFSAYFSAYIALVGCAKQVLADNGRGEPKNLVRDEYWEGEAIRIAMNYRHREIANFVDSQEGQRITSNLKLREVPGESSSMIISTDGDSHFERMISCLEKSWSLLRRNQWTDAAMKEHAEACAYLLRKIRNRLFHGGKFNDPNGSDADLLDKVNPLVFGVVEALLVH